MKVENGEIIITITIPDYIKMLESKDTIEVTVPFDNRYIFNLSVVPNPGRKI